MIIIIAIILDFIWRTFRRMDKKILEKIKKKQHHISTNLNLRDYSYIPIRIDGNTQIWQYYIPKYKSLEEKIEFKQKNITTNANLRKYRYIPTHKQENEKQCWALYHPKSKSLKEKIDGKQKFISTNEDISEEGYIKNHFSKKNNIQIWIFKEYDNAYRKNYKKSHITQLKKFQLYYSRTEKRKQQLKDYYQAHKEERKKYKEYYRNTPNGKLAIIRGTANHKQKGFLLLFELKNVEDIEFEYHHINANLPFVIPIPKEIHRSIGGRNPNHYFGVTQKFCEWLKDNPHIKIKSFI